MTAFTPCWSVYTTHSNNMSGDHKNNVRIMSDLLLNHSFQWDSTKEGSLYWSTVHDKLVELANQQNRRSGKDRRSMMIKDRRKGFCGGRRSGKDRRRETE